MLAAGIYRTQHLDTLRDVKLTRWIIAAVIVLGTGGVALGNGVKFPQIGYAKMPEIPQQRALIAYKDGIETLVVESAYVTDSPEVGWVLPVPAEPMEISVADRDVLKSVAMCMRPEVVHDLGQGLDSILMAWVIVAVVCLGVIFSRPEGNLILASLVVVAMIVLLGSIMLPALSAAGPSQGQAGVSAISVQRVGNYDVTVLKSASAEALQIWLKEQGLAAIPAAGVPVVNDYAKQGWVFLVAKLARQGDGAASAHPLAVKFATKQAVFPMRLTALANTTTQVDLYIIAAGQVASPAFALNSVDRYQPVREGPAKGVNAVIAAHYEAGKTRLAIGSPEAAKWLWPGCIVTHLSARLHPADMGKDVWLTIGSVGRPYRQTVYSEQGRRQSSLVDLLIGGILITIAMAIICRHRRRPLKQEMMAVGVVAVVAVLWSGYDWLRYPVVPLVMDPNNAGQPLESNRFELRDRSEDVEAMLQRSLTEPTTRPARLRAMIAEALADNRARGWAVNPLNGKLMTEERTPGNYAVREIEGKPVLCLYDLEGRELRIEPGQAK